MWAVGLESSFKQGKQDDIYFFREANLQMTAKKRETIQYVVSGQFLEYAWANGRRSLCDGW